MKQHKWVTWNLGQPGEYTECQHCNCRKRFIYGVWQYKWVSLNEWMDIEPVCIERPETEPDPSGPYAMGPGH